MIIDVCKMIVRPGRNFNLIWLETLQIPLWPYSPFSHPALLLPYKPTS